MVQAVVGREPELAALAEFIDSREPTLAVLSLEGEAGIGKTTLWRAGVEKARDAGYHILSCRPSAFESSLPFASLGDLLEPVLERELPRLRESLREALEVALLHRAPPDAPIQSLAVGRALLGVLRGVLEDGSVLVAVDDVKWLDASTTQALTFAVRRLEERPLRVLVSQRASDEPLPLPLEVAGRVRSLPVGPLSADDVARLVESRVDIPLAPPLVKQLHQDSGGNPYTAIELARTLREGVRPEPGRPIPAPESIAALLRGRLSWLSAAALDAVALAAASAQPTSALLEEVTGSTAGEKELLAAGILESERGRLRFTHPLLASVAYHDAGDVARREAHVRLAVATTDAHERALHLARGTERADAEVATELDEAAGAARRRGAPTAAAELADHACRLTPANRASDLRERTARSAEYHLAAGDSVRGRELLERAVAATPEGNARAKLLVVLGQVRYTGDDVEAARTLFDQAVAEAGADDSIRAEALQASAFTSMLGGDISAAVEHANRALMLAERLGDERLLALALSRAALMRFLSGRGLDRDLLERAVQLEQHVGEVPVEWAPTYTYAGIAMFADELDLSRDLHLRAHRASLEHGDERAVPALLFAMSRLECTAGDWVLAERYADEAVKRSTRTDQAIVHANALSAKALVSALTGRVQAARDAVDEGLAIATQAGAQAPLAWITSALGLLELSLGDPAAAHASLGFLSEVTVRSGLAEPGVVRFLPDEIEALIALGEFDAARAPLQLLEERARAVDRASARAAAARCRALLQAAHGEFDRARDSIAGALAQHARIVEPFERGRTLLAAGTIERRARRRAPAREALTAALELFDTLGAALWAEKASAELARIPGRLRASTSSDLSPTERRIAELVAEGLTNREVAGKVFVTERTVEANLSRIYAKLGIHRRGELSARLRSQIDVGFHD